MFQSNIPIRLLIHPTNQRPLMSFLDLRHVYADPAAVIFQVRQLRKFFPRSPIHAARLKRLQVVVSVLRDGVGWHAMG